MERAGAILGVKKSSGRASPLGQSATHDRMGLDHRGAVDMALEPDSEEGRTLISFLRTNVIPVMAFRSRVLGMATG